MQTGGSTSSYLLRALNPFARVRWSDGTLTSLSFDRIAWSLNLLSWVATLAVLVMVWWDEGSVSSVYWYSFPIVIYLADAFARERLRRAVSAAERNGIEPRRSLTFTLRYRFFDSMAQRCDGRGEELQAQAAEAEIRGDFTEADACRRRAVHERKWAEKCRALTGGRRGISP